MNGNSKRRPDHQRLFRVASEQGGYFTNIQAAAAGFSRALLSHHYKAGHFVWARRGLYRYPDSPPSSREDVIAAWLAADPEGAIVSHESALHLLKLSGAPEAVHLTVPRAKRYLPSSRGVAIHATTHPLSPRDVTVREGIRLTSAARSIVDAAEAGTAPERIADAAAKAIRRGMTTREQILRLARGRGPRVERLVLAAVAAKPKRRA